ncbi:unnamed protein product, partial [Effrenium voratum]
AHLWLGFEVNFELQSAAFVVWLLEWFRPYHWETAGTDTDKEPSMMTFFVCPSSDVSHFGDAVETWRKVPAIFDSALGVSMRCAEEAGASPAEAAAAAERFLSAVLPDGIWVILASEHEESFQLARSLAARAPAGLGRALRTVALDLFDSDLTHAEGQCLDAGQACFSDFGFNAEAAVIPNQVLAVLFRRSSSEASKGFGLVLRCRQDVPELQKGEEPLDAVEMHLAQFFEAAKLGFPLCNVFEAIRRSELRTALDVAASIDETTSYEDGSGGS